MSNLEWYRNRTWRELKFGAVLSIDNMKVLDSDDLDKEYRHHVGLVIVFAVWRLSLNWWGR